LAGLYPHNYQDVIAALNAKSGKHVELLDRKDAAVDPTEGSKDVDAVLPAKPQQALSAVKQAMEAFACRITKEKGTILICRRAHLNMDRTGFGGDVIQAQIDPDPAGVRVRIETPNRATSGRNWSTPVYQEMRRQLGLPLDSPSASASH
jgi:hypothetical protein